MGLFEVYSPHALPHGLELAANMRVKRIGMLLQGQHNQHQLPLIQNRRPRSPPLLFQPELR